MATEFVVFYRGRCGAHKLLFSAVLRLIGVVETSYTENGATKLYGSYIYIGGIPES